jgi:hypothetical protein
MDDYGFCGCGAVGESDWVSCSFAFCSWFGVVFGVFGSLSLAVDLIELDLVRCVICVFRFYEYEFMIPSNKSQFSIS